MTGHPHVGRNLVGAAILILAVVMSVLLISSYLDARAQRNQALARIGQLQTQLQDNDRTAALERAQLQDELRQLSDQIVALGAKPVVAIASPGVPPASTSSAANMPRPARATTTTTLATPPPTVVVRPKVPGTTTTQPCKITVPPQIGTGCMAP